KRCVPRSPRCPSGRRRLCATSTGARTSCAPPCSGWSPRFRSRWAPRSGCLACAACPALSRTLSASWLRRPCTGPTFWASTRTTLAAKWRSSTTALARAPPCSCWRGLASSRCSTAS
ncbi:hypothetical protein H4R23_005888, partial [Coemansia sp. Cherry 401B]